MSKKKIRNAHFTCCIFYLINIIIITAIITYYYVLLLYYPSAPLLSHPAPPPGLLSNGEPSRVVTASGCHQTVERAEWFRGPPLGCSSSSADGHVIIQSRGLFSWFRLDACGSSGPAGGCDSCGPNVPDVVGSCPSVSRSVLALPTVKVVEAIIQNKMSLADGSQCRGCHWTGNVNGGATGR